MKKVLDYIKNHWRAISFIIGLIGCLVLVIGADGWSDYADTKFWQIAWYVFGALGLIGFIGGIHWFSKTKKKW